jgi:hypothetical protein
LLWRRKLGLAPPQPGSAAMSWGSQKEDTALAAFHSIARGVVRVRHCAFDVLQRRDAEGSPMHWIGASPDGVLEPVGANIDTHQQLVGAAFLDNTASGSVDTLAAPVCIDPMLCTIC